MQTVTVRPASRTELDALYMLDTIAQTSDERRAQIERWIDHDTCYLAVTADHAPAGYGVFDYSFYDNGFVVIVYVAAHFRKRGIAFSLLQHFETLCRTPKIFTSTNLSNLPMQALLAKLNYSLCGVIHQLDENDPELVYFKSLSVSNKP